MWLNTCHKNVKNIEFVAIRCVPSSSKCTRTRFRPELCSGPRCSSLRRPPPGPLVGWGGDLPPRIPIPSPFNAFSISILRPLHNKIPGHACVAQDAAMCTFARPWIKNSEVISHRYIYSSRCFCSSCYWGWGRPLQKGLKLRRFKSDRDEIWHECSSNINNHRLTRARLLLVLLHGRLSIPCCSMLRHMCLLG